MLHITSWMQGLSKNRVKEIKLYQHDFLRDVRRQRSYIYDTSADHYHYDAEDYTSVGYWGCIRDRNADLLVPRADTKPRELGDVYWGQFEDELSSGLARLDPASGSAAASDEPVRAAAELASPVATSSSSSASGGVSNSRNYLYDFKSSKLKIQAIKRDESKMLRQKLLEIEAGFSKETVRLFDVNGGAGASSPVSPGSILRANLALLTPTPTDAQAPKLINLVHFANEAPSSGSIDSARLLNLKNMLDVLTKLNKSINVFVGDLASTPAGDDASESDAAAKYESIFASMNIHACMNGVNDLYKSYCLDKSLLASSTDVDESAGSRSPGSRQQAPPGDQDLLLTRKMNTVYLCSNIYERVRHRSEGDLRSVAGSGSNFKSFGFGNHSTMILECNGVKIGFMALVDESLCRKLLKKVYSKRSCEDDERHYRDHLQAKIEYSDYLNEAKRLGEQLRLCGASLIVALANMDREEELERLVNEAPDLDLVLCNNTGDQARPGEVKAARIGAADQLTHRWLVKGAATLDCLSLISLKVDPKNANKIVDVAITKYNVN